MNKQQNHHLRTNKSFQVFLINKVVLSKFHQSKKERKYRELIQSNTTSDPVFLINKVALLKFLQSKEEGKYQELIQSNTTPDPVFLINKVALLKFHQSKEEGKYQELIQSNTTPDPGHHAGNVTKTQEKNHIQESQEVSPFQHVTTRLQETGRQAQNTNGKKDPQLKHHLGVVSKKSNRIHFSKKFVILIAIY